MKTGKIILIILVSAIAISIIKILPDEYRKAVLLIMMIFGAASIAKQIKKKKG